MGIVGAYVRMVSLVGGVSVCGLECSMCACFFTLEGGTVVCILTRYFYTPLHSPLGLCVRGIRIVGVSSSTGPGF